MNQVPERPGLGDGDKARRGHQWSWVSVLTLGAFVIILTNWLDRGGWLPAIFLARSSEGVSGF